MKDTFVPNSVRCVQTVKEERMMSLVKRFAAKNHSLPFKPEVLIAAILKNIYSAFALTHVGKATGYSHLINSDVGIASLVGESRGKKPTGLQ